MKEKNKKWLIAFGFLFLGILLSSGFIYGVFKGAFKDTLNLSNENFCEGSVFNATQHNQNINECGDCICEHQVCECYCNFKNLNVSG